MGFNNFIHSGEYVFFTSKERREKIKKFCEGKISTNALNKLDDENIKGIKMNSALQKDLINEMGARKLLPASSKLLGQFKNAEFLDAKSGLVVTFE